MSARPEHSFIKPVTTAVGATSLELPRPLAPVLESRIVDDGHARRVGHLSALLARAIDLPEDHARLLRRAAPFHDIGLIGVPRAILDKPGRLSSAEFEQVEQHTELGAMLLSRDDADVTRTARLIAWLHHERFDGSGYPNHLAGEDIPLEARIVAIADVFDALTRPRPHRPARTVEQAVAALRRRSGGAFDPGLVTPFLRMLGERNQAGVVQARPLDLSGLGLGFGATPTDGNAASNASRPPGEAEDPTQDEAPARDEACIEDEALTLVAMNIAGDEGDETSSAEEREELIGLFADAFETLPVSAARLEPATLDELIPALLDDAPAPTAGGAEPVADTMSGLPVGDASVRRRVADVLTGFGYRVEDLAFGRLLARADLGRRSHSVLIHVLPTVARSTLWSVEKGNEEEGRTRFVAPVDVEPPLAALQDARRRVGATYLAIFGDHRDLHCLHEPAGPAGATLWPWDAVDRARDLSHTLLVDPLDLEPHFERDGFFDGGFDRFERILLARVAERGAFSSVLARLATLSAPALFLAADLADELQLPAERLLGVLERLSEAPYQLLTRVGGGEYCLRYPVADALTQLSEYALNLRARLPSSARTSGR